MFVSTKGPSAPVAFESKIVDWPALLVVSFLNIVIVSYFWIILGPHYTPVNDAWVFLVFHEQHDSFNMARLIDRLISGTDSRVFRNLPYALAGLMGSDSIASLRLILFLINVLTGVGLFLVLTRFFPENIPLCTISSLLIAYFPLDGTMFWLGAFGVNLGFLFNLLFIYFYLTFLSSRNSYTLLILSLTLFVLSAWTYPGYMLLQVVVIGVYLIRARSQWRNWWWKAGGYVGLLSYVIVTLAMNAFLGRGRDGAVLSMDLSGVVAGHLHAMNQLYIGSVYSLLSTSVGMGFWMTIVLGGVVLYFVFDRYYVLMNGTETEEREAYYYRLILVLGLLSLVIVVAGYAPFSVSDVRFGSDRQLLFSRPGVVLFYCIGILFLVDKFSMQLGRTWRVALVAAIFSVIIGLSVQSKSSIANEYATTSEAQRIILGDLASVVPGFIGSPHILIYVEEKSVLFGTKPAMFINRPQYPARYLYERSDLEVTMINPFYLKRNGWKLEDGVLTVRNVKIPIQGAIALKYADSTGFEIVDELRFTGIDRHETAIRFASDEFIDGNAEISSRQKWFVDERDRLIERDWRQIRNWKRVGE